DACAAAWITHEELNSHSKYRIAPFTVTVIEKAIHLAKKAFHLELLFLTLNAMKGRTCVLFVLLQIGVGEQHSQPSPFQT
ncbi:MAG TPA: hypothetical protein VHT24_16445, partial [Pseudacidobacterium sp.]|nr:hypothetical protein [Pseudacidobacterium sp.]